MPSADRVRLTRTSVSRGTEGDRQRKEKKQSGESEQRSGNVLVDIKERRAVGEEEMSGIAEGQQARTKMQVRRAH